MGQCIGAGGQHATTPDYALCAPPGCVRRDPGMALTTGWFIIPAGVTACPQHPAGTELGNEIGLSRMETTTVHGRRIVLAEPGSRGEILSRMVRQAPRSVFFCNVHMLMLAREDAALAQAMDAADLVFADGVPVAWLQGRLSGRKAAVIRGYEAMLHVCAEAERSRQAIGLYGSTVQVLEGLHARLAGQFPALRIAWCESPPYAPEVPVLTDQQATAIQTAGIAHLFVGLGCPKQEKWIHRHAQGLQCSLYGVGAAFDWLAGKEPLPPRWMESSGLGWLHRLLRHPRRMFHRYLNYNVKFLVTSVKLLARRH